jgi:hypothetical protein
MRVGRIEDEIRSALKANQCKTCNTFLYTCGRPGANGFADNRQKIADRIGCDVYGTRQTIFQVFRNRREDFNDNFLRGKNKSIHHPYSLNPEEWGKPCSSDPPGKGDVWTYGPAGMYPTPTRNPLR